MPTPTIPGEAIRKLRHLKGYMQKVAADKMGITQQAYSKLELSESIKPKKVWKILSAFDCTGHDFEKMNGYPLPPLQNS